MSYKPTPIDEYFMMVVIFALAIGLVFIIGVFAIPIGIGGGIFYYFYKQKNPKPQFLVPDLPEKDKIDFSAEFYQKVDDHDLCNYVFDPLYDLEPFVLPKKPDVETDISMARYRDQLAEYEAVGEAKDFVDNVYNKLSLFVADTKPALFQAKRPLNIHEVTNLAYSFAADGKYFKKLTKQLDANYQRLGSPDDYRGDPCDYLANTPLAYLADKPLQVGLKNRFEHAHILAGTGAGKTQLIQYMISEDLKEDCTVVVIDNQRQMIPKLASLGVDMQYISPHYPLALNLFDMPQGHHTAPLLQYVLSGIMEAPLTPKQELIFQFGVTLMLAHKGNIGTFQRLLEGEQFDLSVVDDTTRRFFETEFYNKGRDGYESTRKEINWRIWSLLKNPVLRDMFAAKENRCALELNRKLVLIDTDVDLLQNYSAMFGRFFIAQLLQAAQHRFQGDHKPVYVYIDECYFYLDQNIASMLETARKAKIGLIMAHQFLAQITEPRVSSALMSLTSTKFAAQLSPSDASQMAQAMHTTPDFIRRQEPLNFALWQKGQQTLAIAVKPGIIESMPSTMPDHDEMVRRYGRSPDETPPPPPEEPTTPPPPPTDPDNVDEVGKW